MNDSMILALIAFTVLLVLTSCTNNMQSSQIVGINVISVKDCNETRTR